jgi:replicative superfamily II helicase
MDIAVCTIEKISLLDPLVSSIDELQANAPVNSAIEECTVSKLGDVVMDELHMLDDDRRGYLMEIMATKLLSLGQSIQMIAMSATVSLSLRPI